jgi:4a-hydroxytetrahydrobiopterin dehydratase
MLPLFEIQSKMKKLINWALDSNSIVKDKVFKDFKESIEFVNKVSEIAEKHNHHPSIFIKYNTVRISLTTHEAKGLTMKDFMVAEEIDKI